MLLTIFAHVLVWMSMLAPGRDHGELAWAIALNARSETEAAVITAVAFRESSLRADAVGDYDEKKRPHSYCAMQIHDTAGGTSALLADTVRCVTQGAEMLRESRRIDPENPIAFYARGPRWYKTETAQRISRDRMAIAARLVRSTRQAAASSSPSSSQ